MNSLKVLKQYTYNYLPERGKECAKGLLWSLGALTLLYGGHLLYEKKVCERSFTVVPNCGNDPTLTAAVHTVLPASVYTCSQRAQEHFNKAFF